MDVLIHISKQLSNSTTPAFEPTAFQISSSIAAANMIFFLSLGLILYNALLAILVKKWLHKFPRGWRKHTVAHLRAQERERRLQRRKSSELLDLVHSLQQITQLSVILFLVGVVVLIFPLHRPSGILLSVVLAYCFSVNYIIIVGVIVDRCLQIISEISRVLDFPLDPTLRMLHKDFRPDSDPETHILVLERLVSTTVEAVENIPIFLELFDQPVKDATLRPFNMKKWKELLHFTLGSLRDQPTLPVSTAWTLARTIIIYHNRETADRQLCRTLQHQLGSRETGDQRPCMPFNRLFSSYLSFWLGDSNLDDLSQTIAFLEPSDAADAELLWMVNTFHKTMQSENHDDLGFYIAVLTYVSNTEQSKRSKVPLTAAVISAMHTIRSARGTNSIDDLCILPGTVSTFAPPRDPPTFCHVDSAGTLDLWSDGCNQLVKDLLQ